MTLLSTPRIAKIFDCGKRGYPLFIEALATIEVDREHWNQKDWARAELLVPDALFSSEDGDAREDRLYDLGKKLAKDFTVEASCGTGQCLAGWACSLGGQPLEWEYRGWDWGDNGAATIELGADMVASGETVAGAANALLGFHEDPVVFASDLEENLDNCNCYSIGDAISLYDGANSAEDLARIGAKLYDQDLAVVREDRDRRAQELRGGAQFAEQLGRR